MRIVLAILCLMIFSCQVLPVRSIGKLLSKGQTEEEVKHSCDGNNDDLGTAGKYIDLINHPYTEFSLQHSSLVVKIANAQYDDDLPAAHIADIPSPPPNC